MNERYPKADGGPGQAGGGGASDGAGKGGGPVEGGKAFTPEDLLRLHGRSVMAVCLANAGNRHDAEDIMQQVFTKALAKFNDLRDPQRIRPWLLQIARRACIDHHRRSRPTVELADQAVAPSASEHPMAERLLACVQRLPQDYREVITAYYLDGRSSSGVAEWLGISEAVHECLREEKP